MSETLNSEMNQCRIIRNAIIIFLSLKSPSWIFIYVYMISNSFFIVSKLNLDFYKTHLQHTKHRRIFNIISQIYLGSFGGRKFHAGFRKLILQESKQQNRNNLIGEKYLLLDTICSRTNQQKVYWNLLVKCYQLYFRDQKHVTFFACLYSTKNFGGIFDKQNTFFWRCFSLCCKTINFPILKPSKIMKIIRF